MPEHGDGEEPDAAVERGEDVALGGEYTREKQQDPHDENSDL